MIESLPDVSHLRYRGERVEWRWGLGDRHIILVPTSEHGVLNFFADVYPDELGGVVGRLYEAHYSSTETERFRAADFAAAALTVVCRCIGRELLSQAVALTATGGHALVLSPELLALASAVAQRQGQSLDDLLTRIVTTKVVSIAVVDYRDDPEIRRLHINLAESWGKE